MSAVFIRQQIPFRRFGVCGPNSYAPASCVIIIILIEWIQPAISETNWIKRQRALVRRDGIYGSIQITSSLTRWNGVALNHTKMVESQWSELKWCGIQSTRKITRPFVKSIIKMYANNVSAEFLRRLSELIADCASIVDAHNEQMTNFDPFVTHTHARNRVSGKRSTFNLEKTSNKLQLWKKLTAEPTRSALWLIESKLSRRKKKRKLG